jgi:hypothetical protein
MSTRVQRLMGALLVITLILLLSVAMAVFLSEVVLRPFTHTPQVIASL